VARGEFRDWSRHVSNLVGVPEKQLRCACRRLSPALRLRARGGALCKKLDRVCMNGFSAAGGQLSGSRHRVARGGRSCVHAVPRVPARGVRSALCRPALCRRRSLLLRCVSRPCSGDCRHACAAADVRATCSHVRQVLRCGPRRQLARSGYCPAGGGLLGACLPSREACQHVWDATGYCQALCLCVCGRLTLLHCFHSLSAPSTHSPSPAARCCVSGSCSEQTGRQRRGSSSKAHHLGPAARPLRTA
jgi:hypothetical protein